VIGEMAQKGGHFAFSHLRGMAFSTKEYEFSDPPDIGLFGSNALVFKADHFPNLPQEPTFSGV
jgi:hypothetical protein